MIYQLPKAVTIDGEDHAIRYDFRVILTILELLNDEELDNISKAEGMLEIFYVDPCKISNLKKAVEECYRFIDLGEISKGSSARVMDWEQDFSYIIAPINRVLGYEAREVPYDYGSNTGGLHWWTFMSAYMEIGGDCLFSQVVSIRDKLARGKNLDKYERDWMNRNLEIVRLKNRFTKEEHQLISEWTGEKKHG